MKTRILHRRRPRGLTPREQEQKLRELTLENAEKQLQEIVELEGPHGRTAYELRTGRITPELWNQYRREVILAGGPELYEQKLLREGKITREQFEHTRKGMQSDDPEAFFANEILEDSHEVIANHAEFGPEVIAQILQEVAEAGGPEVYNKQMLEEGQLTSEEFALIREGMASVNPGEFFNNWFRESRVRPQENVGSLQFMRSMAAELLQWLQGELEKQDCVRAPK
ncbi:MAG TPA: hypothetical protein VGQ49_16765 [Bryobacteraceae bacterium]|jgi:hypothetical protein|nr:hypothetical protein [Bryobacteraceae bacterium]